MSTSQPDPHRTQVIVAIIGVIGSIVVALIALVPNFIRNEPAGVAPTPIPTVSQQLGAGTIASNPSLEPTGTSVAPLQGVAITSVTNDANTAVPTDQAPSLVTEEAPSQTAEVPSPTPTSNANYFDVNQLVQTTPKDFETTLMQIETLPDGTMRWTFDMWNKTGAAQSVYMANGSYVVDDQGNKYDIIEGMAITVQAGERTQSSVTFKAPKAGGSSFALYINNSVGIQFPKPALTFSAILNPEPTLVATKEATSNNHFAFNQLVQTNPKDFETNLILIEILPGGVMRWTFDMWNKTGAAQSVYMANGSYVVDDQGNKYDIIEGMAITVQAGERTQSSVTFKAPKQGATSFSLYINNSIGIQFPKPAVNISISSP